MVRRAFRGRNHSAWSCDLAPARDSQQYHIQKDIIETIELLPWDLIILHPSCQYIANCGNRWHAGTAARARAIAWTHVLWSAACKAADRVCLENPVGLSLFSIKPQWVNPWEFGHGETKKTGLWLHNLPDLVPTDIVKGRSPRVWKMAPSATRSRDRATTYLGLADAMAAQWGSL